MDSTAIIERSKRDSDATWYKHSPHYYGPCTSVNRDQQCDVLTAHAEKPHGRHFTLGIAKVQNAFEKKEGVLPVYPLSTHDHRHTIEANGFFNDFDGKRIIGRKAVRDADKRLHYTDSTFLQHFNRGKPFATEQASTFTEAYPPFKVEVTSNHRRFPKAYSEPKTGLTEPLPNITRWYGNEMDYEPPKMKTEALSLSQWKISPQRTPARKQWRYTYHSAY